VRAALIANQDIIVEKILPKVNPEEWEAQERKSLNFLNLAEYIRDKEPFKQIQLGMPYAQDYIHGSQEGPTGPLSVEATFILALQVTGFDLVKYYLFRNELFIALWSKGLQIPPGKGAKQIPDLKTNAQVFNVAGKLDPKGISPNALERFKGCGDVVLQMKDRPIHTTVFMSEESTKHENVIPYDDKARDQITSAGLGLYSAINILETWSDVTTVHLAAALEKLRDDWNVRLEPLGSNEEQKTDEELAVDGFLFNAKYPAFTIHLVDRETSITTYDEKLSDPGPEGRERSIWGLGLGAEAIRAGDKSKEKDKPEHFVFPSGQNKGASFTKIAETLKDAVQKALSYLPANGFTVSNFKNPLFKGQFVPREENHNADKPQLSAKAEKQIVTHAHAHAALYDMENFRISFHGFVKKIEDSVSKGEGRLKPFKDYLSSLKGDRMGFCSYGKPGNGNFHMLLNTEAREEYPKAGYWKRKRDRN